MQVRGSWAATEAASEAIAADTHRGEFTLQHWAGSPVYLGFGSAPEPGKGIRLSENMPMIVVDDHRAGLALFVQCDAGQVASGGYETT